MSINSLNINDFTVIVGLGRKQHIPLSVIMGCSFGYLVYIDLREEIV